MAGVEIEKYATGHEMSNQQPEKQSFPNTTQNWIAFGSLVVTYNFQAAFFCIVYVYLLFLAAPKLWFLHSHFSCRDPGSNGLNNKHSLEKHFWHLAFTISTNAGSIGKTRVAPKTSTTTPVWWWNLTDLPLPMKCKINNVKSQIFPNTKPTFLHYTLSV